MKNTIFNINKNYSQQYSPILDRTEVIKTNKSYRIKLINQQNLNKFRNDNKDLIIKQQGHIFALKKAELPLLRSRASQRTPDRFSEKIQDLIKRSMKQTVLSKRKRNIFSESKNYNQIQQSRIFFDRCQSGGFYQKNFGDFKRGLIKINTNIGVICNSSKYVDTFKIPAEQQVRRTSEKKRKGYYVNNFFVSKQGQKQKRQKKIKESEKQKKITPQLHDFNPQFDAWPKRNQLQLQNLISF